MCSCRCYGHRIRISFDPKEALVVLETVCSLPPTRICRANLYYNSENAENQTVNMQYRIRYPEMRDNIGVSIREISQGQGVRASILAFSLSDLISSVRIHRTTESGLCSQEITTEHLTWKYNFNYC